MDIIQQPVIEVTCGCGLPVRMSGEQTVTCACRVKHWFDLTLHMEPPEDRMYPPMLQCFQCRAWSQDTTAPRLECWNCHSLVRREG